MAAPPVTGLWLIKSEPSTYSWDDLVRDGRTDWDGVRNNQAALWLKAMKAGERAIFYHSGKAPGAVGVAQVSRAAFPDATDPSGRFVAVEVVPERPLPHPVPLAAMRAEARLSGMATFRLFRLSVTPVTAAEWAVIEEMAGR